MRCAKCGETLREGSLYCDKCGQPVQMVPDYNEFDDYLDNLVGDEEQTQKKPEPRKKTETQRADNVNSNMTFDNSIDNKNNNNNSSNKKKLQIKIIAISAVVCVIAVVILIIGVSANVKKAHSGSFDYQIKQAEKAYDDGDITSAVSYYEKALSLDPDNVDVRYTLADIYMKQNDTDAAMILYQEIIKEEPDSEKAYKQLIAIYDGRKNYDAITSLREDVKDSKILKLFEDYIVAEPTFSEVSGKYTEELELELKSDNGTKIYYSFDGDPVKDGKQYISPLSLDEEKEYTVKAVAVDKRGIYSEVVTARYDIEIAIPDTPEVDPDGGTFGAPTEVSITIPQNCKVYYTWDSTDPSAASTEYTSPIQIPEGNNVLSVIAIDQSTGKCSNIYRSRYEFYVEQ